VIVAEELSTFGSQRLVERLVFSRARLLGHESAATTLNHYAGPFPSDLDDLAVRLDAAARMRTHRGCNSEEGASEQWAEHPAKRRPNTHQEGVANT